MHTPEIQRLLEQFEKLLGQPLMNSLVYGSPRRTMDAMGARVDQEAVYIQSDVAATGYCTYVVVPTLLSKEVVNKYGLQFLSPPPKVAEYIRAIAIEMLCPECGVLAVNPHDNSYHFRAEEEHDILRCVECGQIFKVSMAPFQWHKISADKTTEREYCQSYGKNLQ
jgi:hypothetical protein